MREILFRGKEIATRKWVYGGFTLDAINNPRIVEADGDGCLSHKVDPDTVGQYTGLMIRKASKCSRETS